MLSWIDDVKKFLAIAGDVVGMIRKLIEAYEVPGHGAEAKEKVLEVVREALSKAGVSETIKGWAISLASVVIDGLCWLLHQAGIFTHTPK